jgi:hypothetical protein
MTHPTNKAIVTGIASIERYFDCVLKGTYIHEFDVVNSVDGEEGLIDKQIRLQRIMEDRAERSPYAIPSIIDLYERYLGGRWVWDAKWKQFYKDQAQHGRKVDTRGKPTNKKTV